MSEQILVDIDEAAERLSIGRTTLYRLIRSGDIPTVRIGRSVRVPAQALERWAADRAHAETSETGD